MPEDYVIQPMPDASPAKWHLAHTTWFFEQFLLVPHHAGYRVFHPRFAYLFNSYYNTIGERHCRPKRGLLSRPTVEEVYDYRRYVDAHMRLLLGNLDAPRTAELRPVIEIGLNHEQQHQELMLTDLKYTFAVNPLYPVYRERARDAAAGGRRADALGAVCRRLASRSGTRATALRLRQRAAAAPRVRRRLRAGQPARHQRRVQGVHRRRRLPPARSCG